MTGEKSPGGEPGRVAGHDAGGVLIDHTTILPLAQHPPFDPMLSRHLDLLAQVAGVADAAACDAWQAARHFASQAVRHAQARDEALSMLVAAEAMLPLGVRDDD
ncbi:MAG TPA: hypothetical protein VMV87_03450 [Burkholderiales bacterium]|nr:hypothetical protein [Burkholderiales bacterium]